MHALRECGLIHSNNTWYKRGGFERVDARIGKEGINTLHCTPPLSFEPAFSNQLYKSSARGSL
eukprot:379480-Rhodomonas_salina.1